MSPLPSSWPVRWRLAAASAGLTMAILLSFGAVIGQMATQQLRDNFDHEVEAAVKILAAESRIVYTPTGDYLITSPGIDDFALPNDASVRVFNARGELRKESTGAAALGPPRLGFEEVGEMRVATAPTSDSAGNVTGYVQYGRDFAPVEATIGRLWLFVAGGVLIGTLLAIVAAVALARRAMRPISELTERAGRIAATGDPSVHMPAPETGDEVGELAHTLEEMLRSLDAARGEREAALRRQREFVADASHELRTPLTSILANLELLQSSLERPADEEELAMVDSALRSSGRMSRLVDDLLLLARADAGRIGARRRCDLAEIAGNAAAEVAPTAEGRELGIENERPIFVEGTPDELHRMVLNLLDNAVRHTPPGARIELRLRAHGGDAVVEVGDDGPGVPAELRDQIFERFVRGEGSADTAPSGGSGLGLSIVRAVAQSHGGRAEVADSDLGGALFRIRLPLSSTAAPSLGAPRANRSRRFSTVS